MVSNPVVIVGGSRTTNSNTVLILLLGGIRTTSSLLVPVVARTIKPYSYHRVSSIFWAPKNISMVDFALLGPSFETHLCLLNLPICT